MGGIVGGVKDSIKKEKGKEPNRTTSRRRPYFREGGDGKEQKTLILWLRGKEKKAGQEGRVLQGG